MATFYTGKDKISEKLSFEKNEFGFGSKQPKENGCPFSLRDDGFRWDPLYYLCASSNFRVAHPLFSAVLALVIDGVRDFQPVVDAVVLS